MKSILLFITIFIFFFFPSSSQSLDWLYKADYFSWKSKITLTEDNHILQSRSYGDWQIIKLDQNGELLWEDKICLRGRCREGYVISVARPDGSLLHLTERGELFSSDGVTNYNQRLVTELLPNPENIEPPEFIRTTEQIGDKIIALGWMVSANNNSSTTTRTSINLNTLSIDFSTSNDGYPIAFDYTKDGRRVELLCTNDTTYKIILFDQDENRTFEHEIPLDTIQYSDIIFDQDENIVLVGKTFDVSKVGGVVTYVDTSTGREQTNVYIHPDEMYTIVFNNACKYGNGLLLGGSIYDDVKSNMSIFAFSEAYVAYIDAANEIIWEFQQDIAVGGDEVEEFIVNSSNEIIVTGTGHYTDVLGTLNTFVFKLSSNVLSYLSDTSEKQIKLFPNPTSDCLQIQTPDHSVQRIEIYHSNGQLLFRQTDAQMINVSNFPSGIYTIKIIAKDYTLTKQWVKE